MSFLSSNEQRQSIEAYYYLVTTGVTGQISGKFFVWFRIVMRPRQMTSCGLLPYLNKFAFSSVSYLRERVTYRICRQFVLWRKEIRGWRRNTRRNTIWRYIGKMIWEDVCFTAMDSKEPAGRTIVWCLLRLCYQLKRGRWATSARWWWTSTSTADRINSSRVSVKQSHHPRHVVVSAPSLCAPETTLSVRHRCQPPPRGTWRPRSRRPPTPCKGTARQPDVELPMQPVAHCTVFDADIVLRTQREYRTHTAQ